MWRTAFQFRLVMALLAPLALGACGGPPRTLALSTITSDEVEGKVTIYVATTRDPADEPQYFTGERGLKLSFAKVDITVPRGHKSGELELPDSYSSANPAKHFAVSSVQRMEPPVILADVRRDVARRPANERDVLVFVHGYNTNFADAAYRFAQIVYDSGFKGVPVLFTWPSRAELLAYPYDRESTFYSRDFLEMNLRAISKDIGAGRMDILAHSMGTLLTLETLRQAAIRGDGSFGGKLRNVMLAAPDVDLDVFKMQMRTIKRPVTVFVSADDRALDFSRRFAGGKIRLGALSANDKQDIADLEKLGVDLIDLSDVSTSDSLNHGKFAASPKVVALIGKRLQADRGIATRGPGFGDRLGDIAGGVMGTVGGTMELVVTAPAAIVGGVK
ncbi:alpha/beta fold hydrolase [Bosea caraganae]|uniref:Alpha/beta fold hydrolase n=1 Tax=Bosea caraganae TaxID=2763117 RepID=A0A370L3K2_9HYPH|nr:alpha/beta hydrolase [Bosea caraganae]RDJ23024.1 alpha/beta fold hydrolase [Bosea caraganae]RDJ28804.1 alpha/beta fold hydrolase [Bosea caraganae]